MNDRGDPPRPSGYHLSRLSVSQFRNYDAARLDPSGTMVVLTGPNGAGKTNLLEAVSLLSPGRGLRHSTLSEIGRLDAPEGAAWAVSAVIEGPDGPVTVGTGRDPEGGAESSRRVTRIDGAPARTQSDLGRHIAVTWLTPQMDRLFIEGATNRRRFVDRLVFAFDPDHAGRVNAYTHALRERARLVRQGRRDGAWFDALEQTIAAQAVAVSVARRDLVARMTASIAGTGAGTKSGMGADGPFPAAAAAMNCEVADWLAEAPALAVEDRLRERLARGRALSDGEPSPVPGPHRADLEVRHVAKDMPAGSCSTGEQKALLISLMLAHARLRAMETGTAPLLLLDEIAAHLDETRRRALFEILAGLGGQVWMTGTDRALFDGIGALSDFFTVADGRVGRATP